MELGCEAVPSLGGLSLYGLFSLTYPSLRRLISEDWRQEKKVGKKKRKGSLGHSTIDQSICITDDGDLNG